jgi:hypothetical protein
VVRLYPASASGCGTDLHVKDGRFLGLQYGRSSKATGAWWFNPVLTQVPVRTGTCSLRLGKRLVVCGELPSAWHRKSTRAKDKPTVHTVLIRLRQTYGSCPGGWKDP